MIQIHESSNWIAQHALLIFILSGICLAIAGALTFSVFMAHRIGDVKHNKKLKKKVQTQIGIAVALFVVSFPICILSLTSEAPYSGSSQYTVDDTKTQSNGNQLLVVNDGKSKVELENNKYDETSYQKGDKINVTVQSRLSIATGKQYLSDVLKQATVGYEIKKDK